MAENSKIEWTHHTFNPWWGCIRVSPACKHCYAESWARRVGMDLWGAKSPRRFFSEAHWKEPLKWNREALAAGERRRVFCASMADVFEKRRELDAHRDRLWPLIEATPALDWLLLTKRPENVRDMVPWNAGTWPRNVWMGTTAENQHWASKRLPELIELGALVKFVSAEPLLGPMDLREWLIAADENAAGVNWVIAGGESGPKARPMSPVWAEALRDQCLATGTAFHFKQWGHWGPEAERVPKTAQTVQFFDKAGHAVTMFRLGKHATGRNLDGRTWDGLPQSGVELAR
jgi:protein gp37